MVTLLDNKELKSKTAQLNMPTKEFFSFKTSEGAELNGWMMKPANFNPSKKYPVIMHQYSGPGSQQVLDKWGIGSFSDGGMFEAVMCDKGYIMVCVDGRGTGGRGAAFEKCTYLSIGVKEATDQAEAAKYLSTLPYVDGSRIGIWGWSYGGYNTLMSMSEGSGAFKAGVAIAAPTDWRFYDSVYTERFMRTPKENGDGYQASSAISRASKLKGKLLLIHGSADDNVHLQNFMEYSEALVQANIQFDTQIYTNRNHSTICSSGRCPNLGECWGKGTATFMIGGAICTRSCKFCNTQTGRPLPLDPEEPLRVAQSIQLMKLDHAVITSVDRDDLKDLGASHWAATLMAIRKLCPDTTIEALIPDFQGHSELLQQVIETRPDILSHNLETVRRLSPRYQPESYPSDCRKWTKSQIRYHGRTGRNHRRSRRNDERPATERLPDTDHRTIPTTNCQALSGSRIHPSRPVQEI